MEALCFVSVSMAASKALCQGGMCTEACLRGVPDGDSSIVPSCYRQEISEVGIQDGDSRKMK